MNAAGILSIIKDPTLTYHQRVLALAKAAENVPPPIALSAEAEWFSARGIIFDMGEGHAPFRPRYILPDFERFLRQGSEFLMLKPPTTLREAVDNLLIFYHHVPSGHAEPVLGEHPLARFGDRRVAPVEHGTGGVVRVEAVRPDEERCGVLLHGHDPSGDGWRLSEPGRPDAGCHDTR